MTTWGGRAPTPALNPLQVQSRNSPPHWQMGHFKFTCHPFQRDHPFSNVEPSFYFTGDPRGKTHDGFLTSLFSLIYLFPKFQREVNFPKFQIENSSLKNWYMKLNDENNTWKSHEGNKLRIALTLSRIPEVNLSNRCWPMTVRIKVDLSLTWPSAMKIESPKQILQTWTPWCWGLWTSGHHPKPLCQGSPAEPQHWIPVDRSLLCASNLACVSPSMLTFCHGIYHTSFGTDVFGVLLPH